MRADGLTDPRLADHLPAAGSSLYYALRFVPVAVRPALTLIETFRHTISAIPRNSSEPEVTATRLAWWHEELHTLESGQPRHPLLRACAPLAARDDKLLSAMFALVDGHVRQLGVARFASIAERKAFMDAVHGPLWGAHLRHAGADALPPETTVELGSLVAMAAQLQDLRRVMQGGLAHLTRDFEPADALPDAEWYARYAALEIRWLLAALENAQAATAKLGARPATRALRTMARLATHTLREIARDGARIWERRVTLTPLRKLGLALRERFAG